MIINDSYNAKAMSWLETEKPKANSTKTLPQIYIALISEYFAIDGNRSEPYPVRPFSIFPSKSSRPSNTYVQAINSLSTSHPIVFHTSSLNHSPTQSPSFICFIL